MDKEQQVRINFLDEAQECFDRIESAVLGLSATIAEPEQLDLALRSAHSVKGGAGMMGFMPLSHVAHRIEDFFKILRVRYHSTQIATEVESLLLQGVDSLRELSELHRQDVQIADGWLSDRVDPIFDGLRQHLGDLQDEDEDKLFTQNESADPGLVMFEEEVETILDDFKNSLTKLHPAQLAEALVTTAEKLLAFGRMADLEPFVQLCESIQQQALASSSEQLTALCQQALTVWQRSHALVMRGSLEKLPSQLDGFELAVAPRELQPMSWQDGSVVDEVISLESDEFPAFSNAALERSLALQLPSEVGLDESELDLAIALQLQQQDDLVHLSNDELSALNEAISRQLLSESADLSSTDVELGSGTWVAELEAELELLPDRELTELQSVLADEIELIDREQPPAPVVPSIPPAAPIPAPRQAQTASRMVRIPVEQLYQFNTLFGKLILERNRVNLRLDQLKNFASVMRQRMNQLEESNSQLRKWYDRASLEGIVPGNAQYVPQMLKFDRASEFDTLEMDRYSDLHLISQEQIETVVQLDEVTADIELGLQEIGQSIQELTQTTRSLQANVTRTQMVPFADLVQPFPRLIRDLSLQFGKQVNLKIEGESTLIDRAVVETLNSPLVHLIRNAYDHGIENVATRTAIGKAPQGNITLEAVNRGTQTIIKISDDGGGINLDKIRDRLLQMHISPDGMSDAELLDYIFQPGFTTSDRVTELSGRGVGMDVVRTNLQEIRGDIKVETKEHRGTTFTLTVPYTLSILRVMVLERSGMVFAVPANSIRELTRLQAEAGTSIQELDRLAWQHQVIPLVRLEQSFAFNRPGAVFEMSGNPVIKQPTALVVGEGTSIGALAIDRVWGEQEVSIQPIDSPLRLPTGFISSMVLGDGRVVPLVDPVQILQECLEVDSAPEKTDVTLARPDNHKAIAPDRVNTILVVDDSINVRRYLTLTLEKAGYRVEQAKDGQEAVDKLFGKLSVQAVICDLEMPRLDGYGVLEEVKAQPEFKSLPIIMLTSRSNDKHRKLAMNLGASGYFSKPYNEQELLQKIGELIFANQ